MAKSKKLRVRQLSLIDTGEMVTQQAPAADTDINVIVNRMLKTGQVDPPSSPPVFGDVSHVDYMTYLNTVVDANHAFSRLPARWRERFMNDPAQMVRFVDDPKNLEESYSLGLRKKRPDLPKEPPVGSS